MHHQHALQSGNFCLKSRQQILIILISKQLLIYFFNCYAVKIKSLKSPNSTHTECVVLSVIVLVAIAEELSPRVVEIVLGRTPIVERNKTTQIARIIGTRIIIVTI